MSLNLDDFVPDTSDEPDFDAIGRKLAAIDFSLPENQLKDGEFYTLSKDVTGTSIIVMPIGNATGRRRGRSKSPTK